MKNIIYLSGLPATGKTTLALGLQNFDCDSVLISRNSIAQWISNFKNCEEEEAVLLDALILNTEFFISKGYNVIIDSAGWNLDTYRKIEKISVENSVNLLSIKLVCSINTSIIRSMTREEKYRWDKNRIMNFKKIFQDIPTDIVIDTGLYNDKETLLKARKLYEKINCKN